VIRNLVEVERLPPERIVLVVNGEGGLDDAGLQASVRVVALAENVGPAGGFREGMAVACTLPEVEWLYLCEDDVLLFDLPSPRIENLLKALERLNAEGAGEIGAVVAYGRDLHNRTGHTTIHEVDGAVGFDEVDVASWGASLVSRSVLGAGVLPDDGYFFGYEDFDFWFQVKKAGFRILLDRASAFRVASQMSLRGRDRALEGKRPTDGDEPWRAFYVSRNYFRLARRHGSPTWIVAHFAYSVRRFQLASSKAERSAIVHGLLAGLRGATGKDARYVRGVGETSGSEETVGAAPQLPACAEIGTRRRRVVHVLPCDVARGVQIFARDLRAALAGESDEHHILTLFSAPPAVLGADSCLEVPMGALRSLGFDPRVVIRLGRALDALRPDVVVAHGGEPLKYLAWTDLAEVPLVYFSVGTTTAAARRGARRLFYRTLLSRADFVAGVSAETLDEAESVFGVPRSRTVVLPNGRDPGVFRPRQEATPHTGPVRLAFVGHLTTTKRPFRFLAAVDELRRRGHDVKGVVVGDGPLEDDVRRAAAVSGTAEVLGRRDDVPALLRGADIFVFTSVPEGEGMPGSLIEAALSGLPAVATAVPGASTVIVHGLTGFVVPPDDDEALLRALEQLVTDDELRRVMGAAARERAEATFSLEQSARSWQAFLDRIAPQPISHQCPRRPAYVTTSFEVAGP
jgi:glycosyltransferase involved in cell wall biosynthesis/GT2 family glycosyltransferase